MPARRIVAVAVLVALLGGSACSSATQEEAGVARGSSATGTDGSTATDGSSGTQAGDDDQEVADAAVLTLGDLPAGWTAEPADDQGDSEFDAPECGPIATISTEAEDDQTARARSDRFVEPVQELQVQENVSAVADEELLVAFLDAFEDPALARTCLEAILTASVRRQLEANPAVVTIDAITATVNPSSVPSVGDQSLGYQVQLDITVNGQSQTVYAEFVLVRVGRFGATLSFSGSSPFRPVDRDALVEAAVTRLEDAIG